MRELDEFSGSSFGSFGEEVQTLMARDSNGATATISGSGSNWMWSTKSRYGMTASGRETSQSNAMMQAYTSSGIRWTEKFVPVPATVAQFYLSPASTPQAIPGLQLSPASTPQAIPGLQPTTPTTTTTVVKPPVSVNWWDEFIAAIKNALGIR